jgi:hypothetical protein
MYIYYMTGSIHSQLANLFYEKHEKALYKIALWIHGGAAFGKVT